MDTLRVAAIGRTGRGDWGHAIDTLWRNLPGVEVVAVADESEEGLAQAAPAAAARHHARAHRLGDVPPAADAAGIWERPRHRQPAPRRVANRRRAGATRARTRAVKSSPVQRALIGSRLVSFIPGSVLISSRQGPAASRMKSTRA